MLPLQGIFRVNIAICIMLASASEVAKRSDDTNPLEAVVNRLSQDVTKLQAEVQALKSSAGKKAAFLAKIDSTDYEKVITANSPIHFSTVAFNNGQAFNPTLGVFTAPYSGVYIFSFQLFPHFGGDTLIDFFKNGAIILRARVYDASYSTSEASTMVEHAQAGDQYWLQINKGGQVYSNFHSFFSGALLEPDE
ncbi:hypothetical protein BaRGS_00020813 [Batillaria attramentaria]|uniref:C1q domain-containing protein n=1 Tax=Batillaria attramentaria TaxID=370345 RepID=A0ABD0KLG7_9CAEN